MSRMNRESTELEVEPHKLRSVLDSIASQLEVPFLERRGRNNRHKKDPVEELREVIQETAERERELQACIGIARVLIDNNEKALLKLRKQREENEKDQEKIREQKKAIDSLKDDLVVSEEKYEQVNAALITSEEQFLVLNSEHKRILAETNKLRELPDSLAQSVKDYQSEIEDLKASFRDQFDSMQRSKFDMERKNKKLTEEKLQLEGMYQDTYEKLKTMEKSNSRSQEKLKNFEQEYETLMAEKDQWEKKHELSKIRCEKLKAKVEKLEEDIKLVENSRITVESPKKSRSHQRHHSLLTELESLEPKAEATNQAQEEQQKSLKLDDIAEEEELIIASIASKSYISFTPKGKSGQKIYSPDKPIKLLSTENEIGVFHIESKKSKDFPGRKDPAEEYFTLATQAVKMNSSYMDAICIIPPQNLYEKAMKEDVPFHKWHIWIESQLNSAYIQMLYKKEARTTPIPTMSRLSKK